MKLIIDISEEIYKHVDTIQNGSIGAKQIINSVKNGIPAYKVISSVEPTDEQVKEYCRKRDLKLVEHDFMVHIIKDTLSSEPKTGHWIVKDEESAVCPFCCRNNKLYGDYCKWCGAKMVEPQESEEVWQNIDQG